MSETIIHLIIQLASGALGGNAVAMSAKKYTLGPVGNTIAGAIGGVGGGQLLLTVMGAGAASSGNWDLAALTGQIAGGGIGGGVLTLLAGLIRHSMASHKSA